MSNCNPSIYCSRVCEKGTKGCDVSHLEIEALATELQDFKVFAKEQGYNLLTTRETETIATENGVGPATFYSDATEHAWRGWVHGRSEKQEEACKLCNSKGNGTPCAYPTEINRQQATRIWKLVKALAHIAHLKVSFSLFAEDPNVSKTDLAVAGFHDAVRIAQKALDEELGESK